MGPITFAAQLCSLIALFFIYVSLLVVFSNYLVTNFSEDNSKLNFPTSWESLREVVNVLYRIQKNASTEVLILFVAAYIFKQAFSIPGSVFLNVLAGALFPVHIAFTLVCALTAIGATVSFLFSRYIFKYVLIKLFASRIEYFKRQIDRNSDNLIFFLLFIRIFPFTPNWLINIACPIVGVPIAKFALSVFIGLMPYNYICVQSGSILASMTSLNDIMSRTTMIKLSSISVVALLPIVLKKMKHSFYDSGNSPGAKEQVSTDVLSSIASPVIGVPDKPIEKEE